jgi:cytoskeleton protein RodZ
MAEDPANDFGAYLRHAREARGISLRHISTVTKIGMHTLEALERNDIRRLPGGIFTRGIVRAYAQEIGLDPARTVGTFVARFPQTVEPDGASDEPEGARTPAVRRHRAGVWGAAGLGLSLLFVVLYFAYGAYLARPAPGPAPAGPAWREAPAASEQEPVPVAQREAEVARQPAATAGSTPAIRLGVTPNGPCWLRAVADGREVVARLLAAGESVDLQADAAVELTVGDAGAFVYTVNGAPGRSLGAAGRVVNARITPDNVGSYVAR